MGDQQNSQGKTGRGIIASIAGLVVAVAVGALAKEFFSGASADAEPQTTEEALLAEMIEYPLYREIREFDPDGFDQLISALAEGADGGASDEDLEAMAFAMSGELSSRYTAHYMPRAEAGPLIDYYTTFANYYEIFASNPNDCYNYILYKNNQSSSLALSASTQAAIDWNADEQQRLMIALSEGASEQPRPLNNRAAAEEALAGIAEALARSHPVAYETFHLNGRLPSDPAAAVPICTIIAEELRLTVASEHAADLIRLTNFPELY